MTASQVSTTAPILKRRSLGSIPDRLLPVSFIMGDVNNLKMVNDTFGHREGDLLLRTIATVLHDGCRDEDIIARWGGDEFAVILPDTNVETAQSICRRIKELAVESSGTGIRPGDGPGRCSQRRRATRSSAGL